MKPARPPGRTPPPRRPYLPNPGRPLSLRLIELTVPTAALDDLDGIVEETGAVDCWRVETEGTRGVIRLLVPTGRTEEVTDLLSDRFEGADGFRATLLKVEATIPAVADEDEEEPAGERTPSRVSREELYEDLSGGAKLSAVYVVTVALSAIVAAVGLVRSDVAIIVGAMVIAPLLAPNVALSLAATLGDLDLAGKAIRATAVGAATALLVSVLIGTVLAVDPEASPELLRRSAAGPGDVALALAAGSAGALAFTSGLPAAVIGVMVAVALLPPLVAVGLFLGAGEWAMAAGAAVLVVTNVTAVNLAGVVTFLAQKVQPRGWWEEKRAKKATRIALATWVAMLLVLAAVIVFAF